MASTAPYLEFAPPPPKGSLGALGLAILAHAVLLAVLTLGVQWKSSTQPQTVEAELWSSIPVEAAAPAPMPQPEPPPQPTPAKPEPAPVEKPDDRAQAEAAIALAKAKEKEKEKALAEKKLALEKLEAEKKKLAEQEKLKEKQKKEQADKLARAKEEQQRKQDAKDAQLANEARQNAIKRMEGLAGAGGAGAANSTSTSLEAKALSTSYLGRIRAIIKRNHTYTETVVGNPVTEIEIRTDSSGNILSRKVTKPSGTKSWDDAALNAIDKTERLPLDENGRSPSPLTIIWSAQELGR